MTAIERSEIDVPGELIAECAALGDELVDLVGRLRPLMQRLEVLSRRVDDIVAADHDRHRHLPADERDRRMDAIHHVTGLRALLGVCDAGGIIPDCDA